MNENYNYDFSLEITLRNKENSFNEIYIASQKVIRKNLQLERIKKLYSSLKYKNKYLFLIQG